jgi:DHA2 family multidrug resistance protein
VWFVTHALRTEHPVLDLRTLRHRNLALAAIATFALGANLFGSLLILPLYLQNALGFTALGAGVLLALRAVPTALLAPVSTILLQRGIVAPRVAASLGFLALAGGTYEIAQAITPLSDANTFVPAMIFIGVAFAFLWTPLGIISLRGLPARELGYGAAIFNLSAQIGGAVSIAIVTAMQDRRNAFWWNSLASGVTNRNVAVQQLAPHVHWHDLLVRLEAGVAQQAGILTYRDLLLMLVVPALLAVPVILMTRGTTVTAAK